MEPVRSTATISHTLGGDLAPGLSRARGARRPGDGFERALSVVRTAIAGTELSPSDSAAAARALQKIEHGLSAFRESDCLESAMARILVAQAKHAEERSELARTSIQCKHDQIRARNEDETHAIKKRIEEAQSKSFWGKIADIFKAIGALLSAVSSIFTGPLGIAASVLCVASIVVSHTAPPEWGQWVSLGLSLAAAALTLGSSLLGKGAELATEGAKQAATLATRAVSIQAQVVEGMATVVGAVHGFNEQGAKAEIAELQVLREKLQAEAKSEKEMIKLLTEGAQRGVQAVVKALNTQNRVALAACRAGG